MRWPLRLGGPSSAGRSFHWWQATWHALQPMQRVVSVKKPMGSGTASFLKKIISRKGAKGIQTRISYLSTLRYCGFARDSLCCTLSLHHIAHKHFRLVNRDVRIAYQRRQVVDHVAGDDALVAP